MVNFDIMLFYGLKFYEKIGFVKTSGLISTGGITYTCMKKQIGEKDGKNF